MRHHLKVLLVGRPGPALSQLEGLLSYHRQLQVTARPVVDGAAPSLSDLKEPCDVIVLLVKSSGNAAWDNAVLKAIDKTEILPRDTDGRVHSPLLLVFKPND